MNIGKYGIPDFSNASARNRIERLERLNARAEYTVRPIQHACGHTQGHLIQNADAVSEYARLRMLPCGACDTDGAARGDVPFAYIETGVEEDDDAE